MLCVSLQIGKELGGGHQGAVYELLDHHGKDSGQVLKASLLNCLSTDCTLTCRPCGAALAKLCALIYAPPPCHVRSFCIVGKQQNCAPSLLLATTPCYEAVCLLMCQAIILLQALKAKKATPITGADVGEASSCFCTLLKADNACTAPIATHMLTKHDLPATEEA